MIAYWVVYFSRATMILLSFLYPQQRGVVSIQKICLSQLSVEFQKLIVITYGQSSFLTVSYDCQSEISEMLKFTHFLFLKKKCFYV